MFFDRKPQYIEKKKYAAENKAFSPFLCCFWNHKAEKKNEFIYVSVF